MEPTKHRRGRPATGNAPSRSIRSGATWDEAMALAKERGETMRAFTERALELEIRRVRRIEHTPGRETTDG